MVSRSLDELFTAPPVRLHKTGWDPVFVIARVVGNSMRRLRCPRLGDERLSDRKKHGGEGKVRNSGRTKRGEGKGGGGAGSAGGRRGNSSDLGRALRSVYDDTLREAVPDDFRDLLGKLH